MSLQKEFEYFLEHQKELVKKYRGRVIVIKDQKILGAYDDEVTAVLETQKAHKIGTFLVQKCESGDAAYTQTFQSRVVFC